MFTYKTTIIRVGYLLKKLNTNNHIYKSRVNTSSYIQAVYPNFVSMKKDLKNLSTTQWCQATAIIYKYNTDALVVRGVLCFAPAKRSTRFVRASEQHFTSLVPNGSLSSASNEKENFAPPIPLHWPRVTRLYNTVNPQISENRLEEFTMKNK